MPPIGEKCSFKNYYMPILTYGVETWTGAKTDISKPTATEMRFLRSTGGQPGREEE
jgi:hypothetical protein